MNITGKRCDVAACGRPRECFDAVAEEHGAAAIVVVVEDHGAVAVVIIVEERGSSAATAMTSAFLRSMRACQTERNRSSSVLCTSQPLSAEDQAPLVRGEQPLQLW